MIIAQKILEILFPPMCFGCKKYNKNFLCENCWQKIEINKTLFFPDGPHQYALAAATDYKSEVVKNLIQDLKYNFLTSAMGPIKRILDFYLETIGRFAIDKLTNFVVIPIPLSKKRFRERGFNQAELIAEYIAGKFNLPIIKSVLVKIKDSPKQSEAKDWNERLKNIDECFAIQKPELIAGKNIILVDDVYTSGATINEAIKNLMPLQGDNFKIIVFTLACASSSPRGQVYAKDTKQ